MALAVAFISATKPATLPPHGLQRGIKLDGAASGNAYLARLLTSCHWRYRDALVKLESAGLELPENDVSRHHLGERGGVPRLTGTLLRQHLSASGIKKH
jgi:hypothetical protein